VNTYLLLVLAAAFGAITIYFCWRYYLRRRPPSLVCALMPLGWVAAFGLQVERLQKEWLPVLFLLGLAVAGGSIFIIVNHEMSREKPFR
jgi:drug/metabolite transporter (DMT)-like permease